MSLTIHVQDKHEETPYDGVSMNQARRWALKAEKQKIQASMKEVNRPQSVKRVGVIQENPNYVN
jgi:hypothetical protein